MDQKLCTYAERQSDNKRKADDSSRNNHGDRRKEDLWGIFAQVHQVPSSPQWPVHLEVPQVQQSRAFCSRFAGVQLRRCHVVIVCDEKLVQVPYRNESLTFCGNKTSNGRESRLTIISCSKAQEYMSKGCQVFLAQISAMKEVDKSEGQQIKDVPIVQEFPEVFPKDFPRLPPARLVEFQIDLKPGPRRRSIEHRVSIGSIRNERKLSNNYKGFHKDS
ncbi:hypothetical protein Tco_0988768 [Tanacetum coccineum]|uniref:Reverse transcriptase domain-containing protein n=1 Tax=Tanacetum coccineum TaxID=301880 RepID=A0ABQ5ES95_9ASTR